MTTLILIILCLLLGRAAYVGAVCRLTAERERDRIHSRYVDAMNALAARHRDIDERDAEIDRLRQVRGEYIDHLFSNAPKSVGELRRETWSN